MFRSRIASWKAFAVVSRARKEAGNPLRGADGPWLERLSLRQIADTLTLDVVPRRIWP